jgi:outer membrane protein OmpA-like peptidoglycan-associated protein
MRRHLFLILSLIFFICHYNYGLNKNVGKGIRLKGYCYDRFTGKQLSSKIAFLTMGDEKSVRNSQGTEFNVRLLPTTKFIELQCDGYKPLRMPVAFLGAVEDADFNVKIPMIPVDFKQEKHSIKVSETQRKENRITISFVVYDALNSVPMPCEVCFGTDLSTAMNCQKYNLNGDKMVVSVPVSKQLKMNVKANGYDSYSGKIALNGPGDGGQNVEHLDVGISLIRTPNVLSTSFNTPGDVRLFCNMQDLSKNAIKTSFNFAKQRDSNQLVIEDPVPGQYHFTLTDGKGLENSNLISENLNVKPGLNLLYIKPLTITSDKIISTKPEDKITRNEPTLPAKIESALSNRIDATVFFDQSMYVLKEEAKLTLDSVSLYLSQNPELLANIRGYTDGVGNKKLNEYLAENRVRVVVAYLESGGVQRSRMLINRREESDDDDYEKLSIEEREKSRKVSIIFEKK